MFENKKSTNASRAVFVNEASPSVDYKFGPYASLDEAITELNAMGALVPGIEVGVKVSNKVTRYYAKDGVAKSNFVEIGKSGYVTETALTQALKDLETQLDGKYATNIQVARRSSDNKLCVQLTTKSGKVLSEYAVEDLGLTSTVCDAPVITFDKNKLYITCSTGGAAIYWAKDADPVVGNSAQLYSGAVQLNNTDDSNEIRAIAVKDGVKSVMAKATFAYEVIAGVPTISQNGNTVTISASPAGGVIYYTASKDGAMPMMDGTNGTKVYSGPIELSANCKVNALHYRNGVSAYSATFNFVYVEDSAGNISYPFTVMTWNMGGLHKTNFSGVSSSDKAHALASEISEADSPRVAAEIKNMLKTGSNGDTVNASIIAMQEFQRYFTCNFNSNYMTMDKLFSDYPNQRNNEEDDGAQANAFVAAKADSWTDLGYVFASYGKYYQFAKFKIGNDWILVVNIHPTVESGTSGASKRKSHADTLMSKIKTIDNGAFSGASAKVIIMGDFNVNSRIVADNPALPQLASDNEDAGGYQWNWKELGYDYAIGDDKWLTSDYEKTDNHNTWDFIDCIFVKNLSISTVGWVDDNKEYSDHRGVYATIGAKTKATIDNILLGYTLSDVTSNVAIGTPYNVTLRLITGFAAGTVKVYMGGEDVTSTVYNSSTSKISISAVTGNVMIEAKATAQSGTYALYSDDVTYTVKSAVNADNGNVLTSGKLSGYTIGSAMRCTGMIDVSGKTKFTVLSSLGNVAAFYDADGNYLCGVKYGDGKGFFEGEKTFDIPTNANIKYARFNVLIYTYPASSWYVRLT